MCISHLQCLCADQPQFRCLCGTAQVCLLPSRKQRSWGLVPRVGLDNFRGCCQLCLKRTTGVQTPAGFPPGRTAGVLALQGGPRLHRRRLSVGTSSWAQQDCLHVSCPWWLGLPSCHRALATTPWPPPDFLEQEGARGFSVGPFRRWPCKSPWCCPSKFVHEVFLGVKLRMKYSNLFFPWY